MRPDCLVCYSGLSQAMQRFVRFFIIFPICLLQFFKFSKKWKQAM